MRNSISYKKYWDRQYLKDYYLGKKGSLWDVPAENSVGKDFEEFEQFMNADLPIIDLGCGTGKTCLFLSEKFPKVLGIDISSRAIKIAVQEASKENIQYKALDLMKDESIDIIKSHFAEANVYIRGVLHQLLPSDRKSFLIQVGKLLGANGTLVLHEVKEGLEAFLRKNSKEFDLLPDQVKVVFSGLLPPRGLTLQIMDELFEKDWKILQNIESNLQSKVNYPNGEKILIPSILTVVRQINKQDS